MFLYGVISNSQAGHEYVMLNRVRIFIIFKIDFFSIPPSAFDLLVIELHFFFYFFIKLFHSHLIFILLSNKIIDTFKNI